MSKAPIEMMLDGVTWVENPDTRNPSDDDGRPYATHSGVLEILGRKLRVYRLSDGKAVIHADDIHELFS